MMIRIALLWLLVLPASALADPVRVAVASNFAPTLKVLARQWEAQSGNTVVLSPGSTGKHYAQIINGAPFDAFFAADEVRPQRLEADGHALSGSRFTYAEGRLALWSPEPGRVGDTAEVLESSGWRIAIANPELAPYGRAAKEVLETQQAWERLSPSLVRGQNVSQALQFVASGNADLGFIPLSFAQAREGSMWLVPETLHSPILQQAVQLTDDGATAEFLAFVRSDEGHALIRSAGYETP